MRISHRERLREPSRRFAMPAVLAGSADPQAFSGKRVLVGAEHPLDSLATRMDLNEQRYGFEFHADVINALLKCLVSGSVQCRVRGGAMVDGAIDDCFCRCLSFVAREQAAPLGHT